MTSIQRSGRLNLLDLQGSVGYDSPMDVRTTATSKRTLAKQAWKPLARFFFETAKHRQRVFADSGLTPNDARALFVLDRTRGRSMSELADEWLCDASNATWIVDRLEERGLAERRTIPTDRRVKLVVLTAKGDRTRNEMIRTLYEPPPELLELDLADLEALRDAVARLPLNGAS